MSKSFVWGMGRVLVCDIVEYVVKFMIVLGSVFSLRVVWFWVIYLLRLSLFFMLVKMEFLEICI